MSYFIMLRYQSGSIFAVVDGSEEAGEDQVATYDTREEAEDWVRNSRACNSGQVVAEIYEAP